MIEVIGVQPIGEHWLGIEFSDETVGVRDFAFAAAKTGPMADPLNEPSYFARVFIEDGAFAWPNVYDWIQSFCTRNERHRSIAAS